MAKSPEESPKQQSETVTTIPKHGDSFLNNEEQSRPNYIEWYRVTTELFSKIITPIMVGILLFFFAPEIRSLVNKFVTDVESVEVGGTKISFAKQSSQLTELIQTIQVLKKASPQETQKQVEEINKKFQTNSDYNVLIFYRNAQFQDATKIVDNLLAQGFSSYATSTDLTEANSRPENTIRILYTDRGRDRIEEVTAIIRDLKSKKKINGNIEQENKPLASGDIQVLLY